VESLFPILAIMTAESRITPSIACYSCRVPNIICRACRWRSSSSRLRHRSEGGARSWLSLRAV